MKYEDVFSDGLMEYVARLQALIFEYAQRKGCGMMEFVKTYMTSDFCTREMDSVYSMYHYQFEDACYEAVKRECGMVFGGEGLYDAGWVGYMYRWLAFALNMPSRELVEKLPPERMNELVYAYELYEGQDAALAIAKAEGLVAYEELQEKD